MNTGNFLKSVQKMVPEDELVDFLMWCIEFDIDLPSVRGDIIALYRRHQYADRFTA